MDKLIKYANEWTKSAKHFYDRGDYGWAANHLSSKGTVLEIGCGTGYSSIAIMEHGNKIIAVDKNIVCIDRSLSLFRTKPELDGKYSLFKGNIFDVSCIQKILNDFEFDTVVIWNIGFAEESEHEHEKNCAVLESLGYSLKNIKERYLASYCETMIMVACRIAQQKNANIQIIERLEHEPNGDETLFYETLKEEFGFKNIKYDLRKANSLSMSGKKLVLDGKEINSDSIDLYLLSIVLSPR